MICLSVSKGFTVDGHQFAEAAVQNGATVIVSEKEMEFQGATTIIVPDTSRALAMLANEILWKSNIAVSVSRSNWYER